MNSFGPADAGSEDALRRGWSGFRLLAVTSGSQEQWGEVLVSRTGT